MSFLSETARNCETIVRNGAARLEAQQRIAAQQRAEFRALLNAGKVPERRAQQYKKYTHPRELSKEVVAKMYAMRCDGKSLAQIEAATGYSRATVVRHTRGWRINL